MSQSLMLRNADREGGSSKGGTVPVSVPFSVPVRFGSIFSVPRFFTIPKSYIK